MHKIRGKKLCCFESLPPKTNPFVCDSTESKGNIRIRPKQEIELFSAGGRFFWLIFKVVWVSGNKAKVHIYSSFLYWECPLVLSWSQTLKSIISRHYQLVIYWATNLVWKVTNALMCIVVKLFGWQFFFTMRKITILYFLYFFT